MFRPGMRPVKGRLYKILPWKSRTFQVVAQEICIKVAFKRKQEETEQETEQLT